MPSEVFNTSSTLTSTVVCFLSSVCVSECTSSVYEAEGGHVVLLDNVKALE